MATARDELQRAESAHDLAHLSYTRIWTSRSANPDWCRSRKWTKPTRATWSPRRRSPRRSPHITACEQRIRVAQAEQARFKTLYNMP